MKTNLILIPVNGINQYFKHYAGRKGGLSTTTDAKMACSFLDIREAQTACNTLNHILGRNDCFADVVEVDYALMDA